MRAAPAAPAQPDARDPLLRLSALLDPGSPAVLHDPDGTAVTAARGTVDGLPVVAFCTDATRKGGALGIAECVRIARAVDVANAEGVPVIGLWHSAGAKLSDGIEAMHGIGGIFASMVAASGRVPQISVVLGPAAGGAAYGPALTDVVVMAPAARVFITGPDVVRSVTGEEVDMLALGGPEAHSRRSGVAHIAAASEAEALRTARSLALLLARTGVVRPDEVGGGGVDPRALLPASPRRAYDVRPLVAALVDPGTVVELHGRWAPNVVTSLGRVGGGTVGVVANNPLRKGGCLDSPSAEKAARFVRMCDDFGIPLLVVVDVPGYLPGAAQEWGGVVRRGAKLLYAMAEARVPRVTLVTRKAYGGAYIAMNSRALGAGAVFAWPDAEVAVMGAESAVEVLHRKLLAATPEADRAALRARLVAEQVARAGGAERGLALGLIDEVVAPERTRHRIAAAFADLRARAPRRHGGHGNVPL
ncbi:acyl-CoA carboxylase subunit beta [Saccharothrix syringae]|uniref:Acyl-CoA carboxylase subunit beta n=1 Tax=Saccharothrix syringae TaxID=103733 RepID=A0A5Q0HET7_SACSY|nr:carboxyl transferase domain-containing protein [Saccharothrix syringae]QFZ24475.1 acyl-CoA carboxylase subunit beta [Saccharothrix syringae]